MPLYQLLGGASRTGLLAYGHALGQDTARAVRLGARRTSSRATGPSASRPAFPGLESIYGVASNATFAGNAGKRYDHEPAQRGAAPGRGGLGHPRVPASRARRCSRRCATSSAPSIPLLHDGHHRMTPIQAAQLGKSLEPYDLFWLEDCTPAENQDALRLVRQHTTTPLAIGEVFNTVWDYQQLIREQLIDYVRSAVTHTGGIIRLQEDPRVRRAVPDQVGHARADRHLARSAWRRRCTSGWPSTTSASRST